MFRFKEILLLKTQFVFLSRTLPYSFKKELASSLYLDDLSIIRASCSRSNISYKTSVYKSNKEEERILKIQDYITSFQVREFLTKEDKVIIFCPSISNIILVANSLNCSRYYSFLSKEEKEKTLNSFLTSKENYYSILVTSSSLEEGLDYSCIRLVVYKDIAYSFLGFLQGSSQGGRDSKPSTSMFFYNSKDSRLNQTRTSSFSLLEEDKNLIYSYLLETICRRRQISLYLDNKLVDKCSSSENLCDLCFKQSSITSRQVLRILESTKSSKKEQIKVRELLVQIFPRCIYCFILATNKEVDNTNHSTDSCSIYSYIESLAKEIKSLIKKREVVLIEDSCCFSCLFPTVICKHLSKSNKCLNTKFMFRFLALLYNKREELDLKTKYSLRDNIRIKEFLKIFLSKIYIKELDIETLLGFKELVLEGLRL